MKILTQYDRLAQKYEITIPPSRRKQLEAKRAEGTITIGDLPGRLRRKWPGIFDEMTLAQIRVVCALPRRR